MRHESEVVDTDTPSSWGKAARTGKNTDTNPVRSTGLMSTVCKEGGLSNWGYPASVELALGHPTRQRRRYSSCNLFCSPQQPTWGGDLRDGQTT